MKIDNINLKKKIIVIQGGTASGKTTLCKRLQSIGIPKIITCTTRKPKTGEENCKDYYFIPNRDNFLKLDLIEYAEYANNLYGTSKEEIENKLKKHNIVCTVMEKQGAKKLKDAYPENVVIVSLPIAKEVMLENMVKRHDRNSEMDIRLKNAELLKEDIAFEFADYIIEGNDIDKKYITLINIIDKECK